MVVLQGSNAGVPAIHLTPARSRPSYRFDPYRQDFSRVEVSPNKQDQQIHYLPPGGHPDPTVQYQQYLQHTHQPLTSPLSAAFAQHAPKEFFPPSDGGGGWQQPYAAGGAYQQSPSVHRSTDPASDDLSLPTSARGWLEFDADVSAPRTARGEGGSSFANSLPQPTLATDEGGAPLECQHLLSEVPYAPVGAVRAATRRGETRKVGTRIGESISAWEAPLPTLDAPMTNVFVAQLPFDLPLSAMQDVADAVVPGPSLRIVQGAPHLRRGRSYDGCAFFRMPEQDAARFVAAMHKRVLFDVDGVWVAQTEEQQGRLMSYCRWMQEKRPEERRVVLPRPTPFSAMTAEYALRGMPRPGVASQGGPPPAFSSASGSRRPSFGQGPAYSRMDK